MIIFLYGEDTFRSRQKLKALQGKFKQDVDKDGSSMVHLDGTNIGIDKISEAVGSASLFARKRMIVIEDIFGNKSKTLLNQLEEYLKSKEKDSDNIIIFKDDINGDKYTRNKLFKYLSSQKFSQNFKPLSNTEAVNWVRAEVDRRGAAIKPQAANLLLSMFGNDLWALSNQIDLLVHYKEGLNKRLMSGGQKIDIETDDIGHLEGAQMEENIFALTDAISQKNKSLALNLFEKELDAGSADVYLVHMIIRQFRILLQVKQGQDNGFTARKLASQLRIHPFVVNKAFAQVQKFNLELLKKIFHNMVDMDKGIKTGRTDFKTQLSLLIANI